jgi:hypothetical protein
LIATGSYVIDDGFYTAYCNYPAAAEVYLDHKPNANQQWHFSAFGTGFRICNTINGSSVCLTDGGANGLVDQGQGTDAWTVSAYGGVNAPSGARRLRVRRQLR